MAFIFVHIIIPLFGLMLFLFLVAKMRLRRIAKPPILDLFFLFVTYGGLLMVALTQFFWHWSGMASLGTIYLAIAAPIVLIIIAYRQYANRNLTKYHGWAFMLSLWYFVLAPLTFFALSRYMG